MEISPGVPVCCTLRAVLVLERIPLAPYTTLGVGGEARYFATVRSEQDVVVALVFAKERSLPVFVLGGGSNLLVDDSGFGGLVLHIAITGVSHDGDSTALVRSGAGEQWDAFVHYAVQHNLAGIECLAGIPGTVGGTPVQNVGAYGQEVSESIVTVRAYDMRAEAFVDLDADVCGFAYRTSIFNTTEQKRYIVTRVDYELQRGGTPKIAYADLLRHFEESPTKPTLAQVAAAVREIRARKGMYIDPTRPEDPDTHSAGSFFRNPIVTAAALDQVAAVVGIPREKIPHWPAASGKVKLAAAWLLEQAGFHRGYSLGNAGISSKHTLALINRGGATAAEIVALRERIVAEVRKRFSVTLEQEPVGLHD